MNIENREETVSMKVLVIGGGASGLTAALTASERPAQRRPSRSNGRRASARKLLATGNGRCNLTNRDMDLSQLPRRERRQFCLSALRAFGAEQTLAWFRSMGLLTVDGAGRPRLSRQATAPTAWPMCCGCTLARRQNVTLHAGCEITELRRAKGGFSVAPRGRNARLSDRVIVCAGGAAGGKLGGTDLGYRLLTALGHSRTKLAPSLVQLRTEPTLGALAQGRALRGARRAHDGRRPNGARQARCSSRTTA